MSELNQIIASPKNGTEDLTFNGQKTEYNVSFSLFCIINSPA